MNAKKIRNWVAGSIAAVFVALFAIGFVGALCDGPAQAGRPVGSAPASSAPAAPVAARAIGGDTLSDTAAKLELAGDYRPHSQLAIDDAMAEAYDAAEWHAVAPVSAQTGKAQRGWVAKDLFTAMDFESNPDDFQGGVKFNAHQLSIFPEDGVLNAQLNLVHRPVVDYQVDAMGNPYAVINVVFDFPSNRHAYMQLVGRPGTQGGIIIDGLNAPELLARVMTSTYMHMFIPMAGQPEAEELMFYNEPFKALLSPADRATARAAMERAERDSLRRGSAH